MPEQPMKARGMVQNEMMGHYNYAKTGIRLRFSMCRLGMIMHHPKLLIIFACKMEGHININALTRTL
jgi:hypothetical protein